MMTRVIIGVSTWRDYNFLAPLTGLCWREVIGYEPFFFLAGDWEAQRRTRVALGALQAHGLEFYLLERGADVPEWTLAQNCRQHAAALPFTGETWLVPSDADLWPIRRGFYQAHPRLPEHTKAVLYYANGDHGASFPTCHTALRAEDWRALYRLRVGEPIVPQIAANLAEWKSTSPMYAAATDKNLALWCSDQWMGTERIKAAPWYPNAVREIPRSGHPPIDRLDRGAWPAEYSVADYVDAHMPKAPEAENWEKVRGLAVRLLGKYERWMDDYRKRYTEASA